MPQLKTQSDFRPVQRLDFCYICGGELGPGDARNKDHVPPKSLFLPADREPSLWLPTHPTCNSDQTLDDEKIGQLIALKYGEVPTNPDHRRLKLLVGDGYGAVVNLDVHGAVWRWIRGFHATLYGEPLLLPIGGALVTPFPRAPLVNGPVNVEELKPQHTHFVRVIKDNRALQNLDRIVSNRARLTYECVWARSDNEGPWMCIFGLDLYEWKDLGATEGFPARGCAGFYVTASGQLPPMATVANTTAHDVHYTDPLDPFGL